MSGDIQISQKSTQEKLFRRIIANAKKVKYGRDSTAQWAKRCYMNGIYDALEQIPGGRETMAIIERD